MSIIIANRNRRDFVESCLDSYKSLNCPKELIVIDSNSSDGSREILEKVADILICEADDSVYEAWNKALKLAKGDWVFFLNTDDVILSEGLMNVYHQLGDCNSDIAYGNVAVFDLESKVTSHKYNRTLNFRQIISNPIYFNRCIFRKSVFEKVGTFDEKFRMCADQDFLWRCLDSDLSLKHYNEEIYKYVKHAMSLTIGGTSNLFLEEYEIAKKNLELSKSKKGKKLAKIWIEWENGSIQANSKKMRIFYRVKNVRLLRQILFFLFLRVKS
jgi:glycosyltransferase involved in cell wall biosynthesis